VKGVNYLSIYQKEAIKLTVVIIMEYYSYQLRTKCHRKSSSGEKSEYNETAYQLVVDFKKGKNSVMREVMFNILTEFGVPMKQVSLTETRKTRKLEPVTSAVQ
jgi:hypothetical protein